MEQNKKIMENAILWAKGEKCDTIYLKELLVISECLNIKLSKCFCRNFKSMNSLSDVKAIGAFRTTFKTLDKIKDKLLNYDINN